MSRDLATEEKQGFHELYGSGKACESCGNADVTIRIWEAYQSPAKDVGGDIGPTSIVGAVVICEACGHDQTIARSHILSAKAA